MHLPGSNQIKLGGNMKEKEKNKIGLLEYIKKQKMIIPIAILLLLGLFLLLLPETGKSTAQTISDQERLQKYAETLENKIADLCSKVRGATNVSVTVYFDTGFETVYAYNEESKTTSSGFNSEKKYVTVGSGNNESMVCVLEKMPNICGIAIVCRGGGNPVVSNELINLISSAYGVAKNKIYVTEGKN